MGWTNLQDLLVHLGQNRHRDFIFAGSSERAVGSAIELIEMTVSVRKLGRYRLPLT